MPHTLPNLSIVYFYDYICPFCYIGDRRLDRLEGLFNLDIRWVPFEIHPENPPQGRPIAELGYPPDMWKQMMMHLGNLAAEEGIPLANRTFTTNSKDSIRLSTALRREQPDRFRDLHRALFHTYFVQAKNIGDREVLAEVAKQEGIDADTFEQLINDPKNDAEQAENQKIIVEHGVRSVPAFLIGEHLVTGAVSMPALVTVAREAADGA